MWLVTEHLPNNRDVIEGIFEWTTPGQLLVLKHHNYYGFDGHHQKLGLKQGEPCTVSLFFSAQVNFPPSFSISQKDLSGSVDGLFRPFETLNGSIQHPLQTA